MARRRGAFGGLYCREHGKRCAKKRRPSCRIYIRVRMGGSGQRGDYREFIGTGPEAASHAETKLQEIRLRLMRTGSLLDAPLSTLTIAEFWPQHQEALRARLGPASVKGAEGIAKFALERLGRRPLRSFSRADAEDLVTWLVRDRKVSLATTNRYLAWLSGLLRSAVERGHLAANPLAGLRRAREEIRQPPYLRAEELQRLEAATPPPFRAAVVLAGETGLRRGELFALEWRDVDLQRRLLVVRRSKAKRPREVPLTARAAAALGGLTPGKPRERVLVGGSASTLSGNFGEWAKAAGHEGLRFHDLRHAWASSLARAGVPLPDIMRLGGWASLSMVQRYASSAPTDHAREAIEALEKLRERAPERARGEAGPAAPKRRAGRKRA